MIIQPVIHQPCLLFLQYIDPLNLHIFNDIHLLQLLAHLPLQYILTIFIPQPTSIQWFSNHNTIVLHILSLTPSTITNIMIMNTTMTIDHHYLITITITITMITTSIWPFLLYYFYIYIIHILPIIPQLIKPYDLTIPIPILYLYPTLHLHLLSMFVLSIHHWILSTTTHN